MNITYSIYDYRDKALIVGYKISLKLSTNQQLENKKGKGNTREEGTCHTNRQMPAHVVLHCTACLSVGVLLPVVPAPTPTRTPTHPLRGWWVRGPTRLV
jgi:hypothetical protein